MSSIDDENEISKVLEYVPELGEIFDVKEKVGEGTFSKVFRASVKRDTWTKKEYALKYLIPTSKPSRIASELQCLKDVGGADNIVGIEFCLMHQGHVVIVMPYCPHQRFSDYVRLLAVDDIRDYMKNLLIALSKIHSHGIIHRDIKPNNFLYNQSEKSYALVDFGLAQRVADIQSSKFSDSRQPLSDSTGRLNKSTKSSNETSHNSDKTTYNITSVGASRFPVVNSLNSENVSKKRKLVNEPVPSMSGHFNSSSRVQHQNHSKSHAPKHGKNNKTKECGCFGKPTVCKVCLGRDPEEAPRAGTPGFRAPEVLLKYKHQTTAVDMWSAGVILLSILSKKYPFFRADDDLTALAEIIFLVGTKEIKDAASSIGKILTMNLPETTESISDIRKQLGSSKYLQALCLMIQQEQPCQVHSCSVENESNTYCACCHAVSRQIPESAYDLLDRLLDPNPQTRITAADALCHPFITGGNGETPKI